MLTTTFEDLVKQKYNSLSAAQKKVAEYLLNHLDRAAFRTAVQIGREVEVSETTVIRLSYTLGFSGFSEMQEEIRNQFLRQSNPHHVQQPNAEEDAVSHHPFVKVIENDIASMKQTLAQLNIDDIWKAVDKLIAADQILIIGHRASFAPAYCLYTMLNMMRGQVFVSPTNGDIYEKLYNLTDKSVVVVVSFPRYSSLTLRMAVQAKELGASIISVTDRLLSPVGRISDVALLTDVYVDQETGTASMSSVFSLMSTVLSGIKIRDKERVQARQYSLEQFYSNFNVFIE